MKKMIFFLIICLMMILSSCRSDLVELQATENEDVSVSVIHSTQNYDVYVYQVDVVVSMKNEMTVSLADALREDIIDMEDIFSYAENETQPLSFLDGGSLLYVFEDYNMFVSHAVWDGDDFPDAVYFYPRGLDINEVQNKL